MPEVREWESQFTFNALSEAVPEFDALLWDVTVQQRGHGQWAVCWMGRCLDTLGAWDLEPIPSSRTDEWLVAHRFPLEQAKTLARRVAPGIVVNGHTVDEINAKCGVPGEA